jgi:hypothetical protein
MLLFFDSKKKIFYSFAVLFSTARVAELVDLSADRQARLMKF